MIRPDTIIFSEEFSELAKAVCELQHAIEPVAAKEEAKIKTAKGGEYSYKFANLANCMELVREPMHANGLCAMAGAAVVERTVFVTTRIIHHSSGQWAETTIPLPIDDSHMSTAQAVGSAKTFGRRYTLCALLGIASEDDDGKAAGRTNRGAPPAKKKQEPRQATPAEQLKEEEAMLLACKTVGNVESAANRVRAMLKGTYSQWGEEEMDKYKEMLDLRRDQIQADTTQKEEGNERTGEADGR